MPEIYLLEQLAAFRRYGTLSLAAEHLGLSQPSLSRSMKKLEEELGVTLFQRTKNNIELTETGILAADLAERVLSEEKRMLELVRTFSFGASSVQEAQYWLPLLARALPDKRLVSEIRTDEELMAGLLDGTYAAVSLKEPPEGSAAGSPEGSSEDSLPGLAVLPSEPSGESCLVFLKKVETSCLGPGIFV